MTQFEKVLKRLVEDGQYREAVSEDWNRLTTDYKELEPQEMILLMQVWQATGDPEALKMITLCHCCCSQSIKQ